MIKRLPPKLLLLSVLGSIALHYLIPIAQFISFPFTLAGIIFVAVGWAVTLWSERVIESYGTALHCMKKPTTLVIDGPFRYSRNPFYLGYLIIIIGVAVMLGSLVAFIGPLIFISIISIVTIPNEEAKLQQTFSSEYVEYRRRVRRWI